VGDFSKKISSSIFEQRPKVVSAVPVFDVSKDQVAPQPEKPVPAKALTTDSDSIALVVPPKEPPAERQVAKEGFWMSRRYPIEFKGMDIGDVNRDGLNEVVLIDDKNIMIYRKDSGELKFVDKIEGRSYGRNLAVDVADINKNGVSEIIVTSINEPSKRLNSFVFEYRDGKFTQIASGLEWFMRVINSASGDPLLIGQRQGLDSPFELPIYKIVWKNKEYKEGGKIAVPRGLSVYGLTMCNLGDSRSERVVALDDYDHLCVYTKTNKPLSKIHIIGGGDELIWKSLDVFGGTSNYFEPEDDSNANDTETETPDNVLINVRIIPFDADGDGKKEIAIVRNMSPGGRVFQNVRVFTKGEVCCLEWDGLGLSEIFKTKQIQGYIADYQLKDIDNDGRDELITVVKLSRNKSIVAVYGFGKERAN
jgi:hypothetical protein